MKLTNLRTFVVGNPEPGVGGRYFIFVKLTTDHNVHGVGEAYCLPFHPRVVTQMLEDVFERYFREQDPHDIESLWRRVYSAGYTQHPDLSLMAVLSALEMACWDIIGKEAGQPVYKLLGGRVRCPGFHGAEVRSRRPVHRVRWPAALARGAGALRAFHAAAARCGRQQGGP